MNSIQLKNVTFSYDDKKVIENLNLNIADGQITSLLGPSGSGKTTILRLLAGFIQPQSGEICIGDQNITRTPPEKRNFGMIFQNYALFQNMNVRENIEYGLKLRNYDKKIIKEKVGRILDLVKMNKFSERPVDELSGGQQQRVAIARALVIEPSMLLMDEPLSNLDASLRHEMREEIRMLQKELGITTLFITHDQQEALEISDQIAIVDHGSIIQIGTPYQMYKQPTSLKVAEKFGYMNKLTQKQKEAFLSINDCSIQNYERPEAFQISSTKNDGFSVEVHNKIFYGFYCEYDVLFIDGKIKIISLDPSMEIGKTYKLTRRT